MKSRFNDQQEQRNFDSTFSVSPAYLPYIFMQKCFTLMFNTATKISVYCNKIHPAKKIHYNEICKKKIE